MRLYRHKFLQWLKAKKPDEIVGENRTSCGCPITNFYSDATRGSEVIIFDRWGEHFIDRGYSKQPLPQWAQRFVFEIDQDENGKITAARALEVLAA